MHAEIDPTFQELFPKTYVANSEGAALWWQQWSQVGRNGPRNRKVGVHHENGLSYYECRIVRYRVGRLGRRKFA
jgi:hypothetical protein